MIVGYDKTMEGHKEVSISLPVGLLNELDLYFYDPAMGKPAYGTRSRLIAALLENWLKEQSNDQDKRDGKPYSPFGN